MKKPESAHVLLERLGTATLTIAGALEELSSLEAENVLRGALMAVRSSAPSAELVTYPLLEAFNGNPPGPPSRAEPSRAEPTSRTSSRTPSLASRSALVTLPSSSGSPPARCASR